MVVRFAVRYLPIAALLIAAMNMSDAQAQGRHHRSRGLGMVPGVSPIFVAGNDAVQKELGVNPDKVAKLNELVAQAREEWSQQVQAAGGGGRGQRNASPEDRQKRFAEMRSKVAGISKTVNESYRSKLAEVLDQTQLTRLHEIAVQAAGTWAFQDAEIARDLGLTKAQQDQLAAVHQEYADKYAQLRSDNGQRNREGFAKTRELRQEELSKATDVLTKTQQVKFATIKGKAFDLAQLHQSHGRHGTRNKSDKSA